MSTVVTKRFNDSYMVTLDEPEKNWVSILSRQLQTPDYSVVALALTNGLTELMCKFVVSQIHTEPKDEGGG